MRFIKLETNIDELDNKRVIDFDEKINIFHINDLKNFKTIKDFFYKDIFNLSKTDNSSNNKLNYNLHLAYYDNIYRLDNTGNITEEVSSKAVNQNKEREIFPPLDQWIKNFQGDIFHQLSSIEFSDTDEHDSMGISSHTLSSTLVAIEMLKNNTPFPDTDKHLKEKEEELSHLLKQKQLIEIKKMRKDKLQKEISSINKILIKLNKQLKAMQDYKNTLIAISDKIKLKEKLASKINNYKKEVLELREIKARLNEVEKELKTEFPQFENNNENITDLEQIEKNFITLKEINSNIDKLKNSEKKIQVKAFKIIGGITVFSITAIIFLLIQNEMFPIPFIIASALLLSIIISLISFFKIKKYNTETLIEEQILQQKILSESIDSNRFSFENYKTEELYEFLLQYFDDFVKFNEVHSEIKILKDQLASKPELKDAEKKLNSRISEFDAIEKDISSKLLSLDQSILATSGIENIALSLSEINELIISIEEEITQEESIREKIEHDITDYDKKDNSGTSFEAQILETEEAIKNIDEEKNAIKYMHEITMESAKNWTNIKLEALSDLTWQTIEKIAPKDISMTLINEQKKALHDLLTKGESKNTGPLNEISPALIKAAIIYAIQENTENSSFLPPLIISLQNESAENNSYEKKIKNVLELFTEKQVIIITSVPLPGINGKIIDI